jgi:hypothetical protein
LDMLSQVCQACSEDSCTGLVWTIRCS